jgi:cytochrome c oxidase subunit IV
MSYALQPAYMLVCAATVSTFATVASCVYIEDIVSVYCLLIPLLTVLVNMVLCATVGHGLAWHNSSGFTQSPRSARR